MTNRRPLFWLGLAISLLVFIYLIRSILLPFVLGIFTAYFLDPAADRLEAAGLSRGLSTLIITGIFFSSLILLSVLITPVILAQISGLVNAMPGYFNIFSHRYIPQLSRWTGVELPTSLDTVKEDMANYSGVVLKLAGGFIAGLFQSGMAIVNILSLILVTPVVTVYMLRDWDRMTERLDRLTPRPHTETIRAQLLIVDQTLAGFIRGQLMVCLTLGVFYAIALSLAGLKFGILIGLGAGMLVIFPYVGSVVGLAIGVATAFFQFGDLNEVGVIAAIFIFGQIAEGYFIAPRLVGSRVGLHPVWIIFGMLAGGALFGFVGVLLAVPATAVIGVFIRFGLQRYLLSSYYQGADPAPPLITP